MSKTLEDKFKELVEWGVAFGWNGFGQLKKGTDWEVSAEPGYLATVTIKDGNSYNTYSINDVLFDPDSQLLEAIFGTEKVKVDVIPHHATANFYLSNAHYRRLICIQKDNYEEIIDYLLNNLEAHAK